MNLVIREWRDRKLEKVKTEQKTKTQQLQNTHPHNTDPLWEAFRPALGPTLFVPLVLTALFCGGQLAWFVLLMGESLTKLWASGGRVLAFLCSISPCELVPQSKCLLKGIEIGKCLISLSLFF